MTKKIEAIIRKEKLSSVMSALSEVGIVGLNITEVRGRGRGVGMTLKWRTGTYVVELLPRTMISIVLSDDNIDATVEAIRKAAYTGERGDGMIFVLPVEQVVRISTGETGRDAISYQGDIDTRKGVNA
ncbi:MAG: P-II family nitrogen regulator [Anaerolineae bacterium]|nr:P-II family nitrogen regulator [Anaerolineae bacterium]